MAEVVDLVPVSPANYELARALHVRPDQEKLVGSVQKSLADAYVHAAAEFRLGWVGEEPVGYVLIFPYQESERRLVNVVRLMIDERFQGRGLGRGLLVSTLEWIRTLVPPAERVRISTLPENAIALALYESTGFVRTGIENGEVALYMELDASDPKRRAMRTFQGACHCGRVRFEVDADLDHVRVCDCSVCRRRGALIHRVAEANLRLSTPWEELATYRWGSRTAIDYFCRHCGVLPFRRPSVPTPGELEDGVQPFAGWAVNVRCLSGVDLDTFPVRRIHGSRIDVVRRPGVDPH